MLSGVFCVTSLTPKAKLPLPCAGPPGLVHSQNQGEWCGPSLHLPAFSGAPQARGTTKRQWGLGICLAQEMPSSAASLGPGGLRSRGAFPSPGGSDPGEGHVLCLSLSIFLLVTYVEWPLGKISATGRQRQCCAGLQPGRVCTGHWAVLDTCDAVYVL